MTNDELLSKTISYLRFPLTVGVVFAHFNLTRGLAIHGVKHGMDNPDWYFFIISFICDGIARVCVPLFFIISGFLFFNFNKFDGKIGKMYKQKLCSRARTLLVPYVLWNTIAVIIAIVAVVLNVNQDEIRISFIRIFNTFFCLYKNNGIFVSTMVSTPTMVAPIDGPLWFVRDLMIMVILTPIIYLLIKKCKALYIFTLSLLWYFWPLYLSRDNFWGLFLANSTIPALFFFSLGAFYSINRVNFVKSFQKYKYTPQFYIIILIADVLTKGMEYNGYIHRFGILLGIISAVIIVSNLLEKDKIKVNPTLANSSFFIYAFHILLIMKIGRHAYTTLHISERNPFAMLTLYFIVPIITILVCLSFYMLLKRYCPRLCNMLTGGR